MLVPSTIGLEDLEEVVSRASNELELTLPQHFKSQRIGLLARLVQALITCYKSNANLSIYFPHLDISQSFEPNQSIESILEDPHLLPTILMAEEVMGRNKKPLKRAMQKYLIKRFDNPVYLSKKLMQITAVDHSIEKYAYPESLYFRDTEGTTYKVRNGPYFQNLILNYLSHSVRQSNFSNVEIAGLGELIAELVENTEQHAKSEFNSGKISRSVRGITLKSITLNKSDNILSASGESEIIHQYLTSIKTPLKPLHFLELSVYDSGPGIAASYSDFRGDFKHEIDLVLNSFSKGVTSKPNGLGLGRGLSTTLNILSERDGFISVRTGRLSLFRDFKSKPIENSDPRLKNNFFLLDESNGINGFTEKENVAGVSYTILVPAK